MNQEAEVVKKTVAIQDDQEQRFLEYLTTIKSLLRKTNPRADLKLIEKAYHFAKEAHKDQLRLSGDPYFIHSLEVAKILAEMEMDYITVTAGLLHDVVEDTGVSLKEVEEEFSEEIAQLVDGVTKIGGLQFHSLEEKQAENFRKMIFSMVQDVRVIMIKFADRLHNMRTIEYMPRVKQERIALETREIYAPLAHRLGIAKIKWELEDLAFKVLNPKEYEEISQKIREKREEREAYIRRMADPIKRELKKHNIHAEITGRPKHLYSIYRKMVTRNKPFEEIYDLFALRILVNRVDECYFALGVVHTLYTPIHERFKDYIATPKSNMYQSIHTTVIGPEGRMVEIQIRTYEMHKTAESGIAAHWKYKEGKSREDEFDKQLMFLRQVLDWQRDIGDPQEFMEDLKISLFQDEIFVFTPKGDLIKLPRGATPVDFAFAVHTDIGLHCIGAKVNGKIVPLNTELKSGDSVEIITSSKQAPNPDWIKFVKTSKARSKIKRWLKESLQEESIRLGKELLDRHLKKLNKKIGDENLVDAAQSMGFSDVERLYAALGRGDVSVQSVLRKIFPPEELEEKKDESFVKKFISRARRSSDGVKVQGLDHLLISFAKCCQPVPGDQIVGFITRGRGIVVHRADCPNLISLIEDPERQVEVEWDVDRNRQFMVRLNLIGEDRKNFLRDVAEAIAKADTNIVSIDMKAVDSVVYGNIIVEVKNLQHLTRVINKIDSVKGVIRIERLDGMRGREEGEA
jgi:GTP pyrophosphokinase